VAFFLPPEVDFFPHPLLADEDGLLAFGASLDVNRILLAYNFGIFPWNGPNEPLLWWYTHPRFVLFPEKIKIHKSMRPYLNGQKFEYTFDRNFREVINNCKVKRRPNQDATWITSPLEKVFVELHELGWAHSVEVWKDGELVGGLYGLAIGKIFFGESMFSNESNASKFAFIKLSEYLVNKGFWLIDCQQETDHLGTLGAELIDKDAFLKYLKMNILQASELGFWKK